MNDFSYHRLESLVDLAVRPVWASPRCKRMMREELLAHLVAVHAEEFEKSGDEQAALEITLGRFGAADELGHELQVSLPVRKRGFHLFEKETLMSRWLWFVAVLAIFVGPGLVMPAIAHLNQAGTLPLLPLAIGILITLAGIGLAGYGLKQRFARIS